MTGEGGAGPAHHHPPRGWCSSLGCEALLRGEGASPSLSPELHGKLPWPENSTLELLGEAAHCCIWPGAGGRSLEAGGVRGHLRAPTSPTEYACLTTPDKLCLADTPYIPPHCR